MRRLAFLNLLLVCALSVVSTAGPVHAGGVTLRTLFWGRHGDTEAPRLPEQPLVARYVPNDGESFILDRSVNPPLLRFEDSQEVWILSSQPGPRGDTLYNNDLGQPVLRATKLGGLTLFTGDNPDGTAAAFDGEAASLRPPALMGPNLLFQRVLQASARSSHAAQRVIPFLTVEDATPETAALIANSATVTAEAINRISRQANGRTALNRVNKVLLTRARKAGARVSQGALIVTYAPDGGMGGRPSSERIMQTITNEQAPFGDRADRSAQPIKTGGRR